MVHTYYDVAPSPTLRPYVQAIRVDRHADLAGASRPCRILPDGGGHLLIQMYGDATEPPRGTLDPDVIRLSLVGPRSVYTDVDLHRRLLTVAVQLQPGGAAALLGAPVEDLTDCALPLSETAPAQADRLVGRLARVDSVANVVDVVCAELRALHRASPRPAIRSGVSAAVAHMQSTCGRMSVQDVAGAVGWSTRHLRSVFAETIGLSPKRLARIVRIRQAARRLQGSGSSALAALALGSGFCDQSHMTREFQALLGEPPATFARRLKASAG
jgi:AraC-like DNA-binding protein